MTGDVVHDILRRIAALSVLMLLAAIGFAETGQVDLLIRTARVVDGTGSPWFRSDITVADGRIVDIGVGLDVDASQTIDAAGRVVADGELTDERSGRFVKGTGAN